MAREEEAEPEAPAGPEQLAHMDSVSPEGGYAGLESEREAAEAAMIEPDEADE